MLYAAIDIHKSVLQMAVLDPATGEIVDARTPASREALRAWARPLMGSVAAVALEATSGWRWVWRELCALGLEVHLAEPAPARAQAQGQERPSGRALAGAVAVQAAAAPVLDPAGGDPAPARPDAVA
jgi:transposase